MKLKCVTRRCCHLLGSRSAALRGDACLGADVSDAVCGEQGAERCDGSVKVLCWRIDAVTMAYQVLLDPGFVAALRDRAEVATYAQTGEVAFSWGGVDGARSRPMARRWLPGDAENGAAVLWGSLRFSPNANAFTLINEPYFQLRVRPCTKAGGGELRDCHACRGAARVIRPATWDGKRLHGGQETDCPVCDGAGFFETPGFTLEIIWRAQTIAEWGLQAVLAESAAIAANCGEVFGSRLRRIDPCVDVQGWKIREDDSSRIAKRPRSYWGKEYNGEGPLSDENTIERVVRSKRASKVEALAEHVRVYGQGAVTARRMTGINVGYGGDVAMRCYDKLAELARWTQHDPEKVAAEERRWKAAGWDGQSPVTRVEFQLRGQALAEFGVRTPDECLEPLWRSVAYVDARGKNRVRRVLQGHQPMTRKGADGADRKVTLLDRLNDLWHTCLDWVRLVEPGRSETGHTKVTTRMVDDPRWALLRTVQFSDREPQPLKRYRMRSPASAAQSLGVALSNAAREGLLQPLSEMFAEYGEDPDRALQFLRGRVRRLMRGEAERIVLWLLDRFGGVEGACVHFAVKANAKRVRYEPGVARVEEASPPQEDDRAVA